MGSGRGKSRRTQVTYTLADGTKVKNGVTVVTRMNAWQDFVAESGLKGVSLHEYYVDSLAIGDPDMSSQGRAKLITEIFADMVAAKAIRLPEPYKAEDFRFTAPHRSQWAVHLKSQPGEKVAFMTLINSGAL